MALTARSQLPRVVVGSPPCLGRMGKDSPTVRCALPPACRASPTSAAVAGAKAAGRGLGRMVRAADGHHRGRAVLAALAGARTLQRYGSRVERMAESVRAR
mmetsp:Transcript_26253/g.59558  ORF Transcript_26253/g.59558 Transcript_26253/m.59558 type:complete len:101 (-) Transcript_26253:417-719(-)